MSRSWYFNLRYLLGQPPWDTRITPPEVVELIEEGDLEPGRALDLGCGTGTNCIYLARHGWSTVGVDLSFLAIRRARRKARRAEADCEFHVADVSELGFLTTLFDLLLDIGCLHSLPPEARERYGAGAARLTRPGGLYMLYAFTSSPQDTGPYGIPPEQIAQLFSPAFRIERQEQNQDATGPKSAWYWMRRQG